VSATPASSSTGNGSCRKPRRAAMGPLARGLGAFVHEAIAVDPATGIVYLTEDDTPSGFFRFVPNVKTRLAQGGQLEMLKIVGVSSARLYGNPASASPALIPNGTTFDVEWVPIADPEKVYSTGTTGDGVF